MKEVITINFENLFLNSICCLFAIEINDIYAILINRRRGLYWFNKREA